MVGFIGPEYLYDGKEILRAALEDHFCGKLMGLPMGVDVCYTNHAEADQNDMDTILTMLAAAGVTYVMGVPGADDVMLNYQSTSFHDALFVREAFGLKRAPEFEAWLAGMTITDPAGRLLPVRPDHPLIADASRAGRAAHDVRRPHDPWFFLADAPWRGSAAAEPAHRCRRVKCSPSISRMRWRATPFTPASIATGWPRACGAELATVDVESEASNGRPICGSRMPAAG